MNNQRGLVVPGAYDGVSAKLVERAGFPAGYMTGYGVSASRLGMPDMGFAGLTEMADQARNMAAAVSIPLIREFQRANELIGVSEQFALGERYSG